MQECNASVGPQNVCELVWHGDTCACMHVRLKRLKNTAFFVRTRLHSTRHCAVMLRHFLGSRLAPPAAGLHEWRCIAELRHALPSNQASRSTYTMGTTLMPSLTGPCCSSMAHVQPPVPARTATRAFAAAGVPSSPSGPSAAGSLAVQQLGLRLPERCCGCGINLQQTDPEAPG